MRHIMDKAFATLGALVVAILAAIMVLIFAQVINRYILGLPIFWTEEVVRMLLVWLVLTGTPVVLYRHEEIKVELLVFRKGRLEKARKIMVLVISMVFFAFLAWWGWKFAARSLGTTQPSLGISRAWLYLPIPLGSVLSILALAIRTFEKRMPNDYSAKDLDEQNSTLPESAK